MNISLAEAVELLSGDDIAFAHRSEYWYCRRCMGRGDTEANIAHRHDCIVALAKRAVVWNAINIWMVRLGILSVLSIHFMIWRRSR